MATLNIDIEKAVTKMAEETNSSFYLARIMVEQLMTYHPRLFPIIEAWVNGENLEFEYQGITIDYIMKKQRCCYISALPTMSILLKGIETVDSFKSREFRCM